MRKIIPIAVLALLIAGGAGIFLYRSSEHSTVKYGFLSSAMIDTVSIVASEQKPWKDRKDINVDMVGFSTGRQTVDAILGGEVDFATMAGFPFILASNQDPSLRVVATTTRAYSLGILVNREAGITNPKDLKGRKIGYTEGTTGQFLLERFLEKNGLGKENYTTVSLKPAELVAAFQQGNIAAISTWQPFLHFAESKSDNRAFILPDSQKFIRGNFFLVAKKDFIESHTSVVREVLKKLIESAEFTNNNRSAAINALAKNSGLEIEDVEELWSLFDFRVGFFSNTIPALERQERWALSRGILSSEEQRTRWKKFMYTDALAELRPDMVNPE